MITGNECKNVERRERCTGSVRSNETLLPFQQAVFLLHSVIKARTPLVLITLATMSTLLPLPIVGAADGVHANLSLSFQLTGIHAS